MNVKPIPEHPGYFASECGQILTNKKFRSNSIPVAMAQRKVKSGYMIVKLSFLNKTKTCRVHRLVALTWCKNYRSGLTVNHKDGNKENNACNNLEWISLGDNIRHSVKIGLRKYAPKITGIAKPVWRSRKEKPEEIINSVSISEACREIGVNESRGRPHIHGVLRKKYPTAYGFRWGDI